jgi:hypothetical protein
MSTDCLYNGQFIGIKSNGLVKYTEDECNKLNGTWNTSGECIKKQGGSYSYDCMNYTQPIHTPSNYTKSNYTQSNYTEPNRFSFTSLIYIYPCTLLIVSLLLISIPKNSEANSSILKAGIIIPLSIPCLFCICLMYLCSGLSYSENRERDNTFIIISFILTIIFIGFVIVY